MRPGATLPCFDPLTREFPTQLKCLHLGLWFSVLWSGVSPNDVSERVLCLEFAACALSTPVRSVVEAGPDLSIRLPYSLQQWGPRDASPLPQPRVTSGRPAWSLARRPVRHCSAHAPLPVPLDDTARISSLGVKWRESLGRGCVTLRPERHTEPPGDRCHCAGVTLSRQGHRRSS